MPNTAIQRNARALLLYLLKPDQTLQVSPITVGTRMAIVQSVEGLEAGTVSLPIISTRLNDGAKVTVRPDCRRDEGRDEEEGQRQKKGQELSPSRPFILRPVAHFAADDRDLADGYCRL